MYEYMVDIVRVHDGDTVTGIIDLGFYMSMQAQIRLLGINAPELSTGAPGEQSTQTLMNLMGGTYASTRLPGHFGIEGDYVAITRPRLVIQTQLEKPYEKYGRVLGTLFVQPFIAGSGFSQSVNKQMIDLGAAVAY